MILIRDFIIKNIDLAKVAIWIACALVNISCWILFFIMLDKFFKIFT
jgi:hypothetical protein